MKSSLELLKKLEAALPQTQCQLCEYDDCHAYAKAVAETNEHIDRCHPGGETTLRQLALITKQDPEPFLETVRNNTKAMTLAVIRENECIGCTKCIQACPVDAIIGSGKQMHTVLSEVCNGCELCIPPCPVDCIDVATHTHYQNAAEIADQSRQRYQQHQQRSQQQAIKKRQRYHHAKNTMKRETIADRKALIQAAIQRAKSKESETR